jgi:hypothetical protein
VRFCAMLPSMWFSKFKLLSLFLLFSSSVASSDEWDINKDPNTVPPPMTEKEKRDMASQLQKLEEKRQAEAPQQFAKELEMVMKQMMSDPDFFANAMREAQQSPEFQELFRMMQGQMQKDLEQVFQLLNSMQQQPIGRGGQSPFRFGGRNGGGMAVDMRELEKVLKELGIQTQ